MEAPLKHEVFAGGSPGRLPLRVFFFLVVIRAVGVGVAGSGEGGEAGVRGQQGEHGEAQEGDGAREVARQGGDDGVRKSGGCGGKSVVRFWLPIKFHLTRITK